MASIPGTRAQAGGDQPGCEVLDGRSLCEVVVRLDQLARVVQLGLDPALPGPVHEQDRGQPLAEGEDGVVAPLRPLLQQGESLDDGGELREDRGEVLLAPGQPVPRQELARAGRVPRRDGSP